MSKKKPEEMTQAEMIREIHIMRLALDKATKMLMRELQEMAELKLQLSKEGK